MSPVTIYTTGYCPYCHRAKELLERLGIAFDEIDVTDDDERRAWLVERTGRRTVPQIFFGERSIGGYDDLAALVKAGEIDSLVRG